MYTLFISDTHLDSRDPARLQTFLTFIQEKAMRADALYILGDFFEVWIGDDDRNVFNQTIIKSLRALSNSGVPIYFMPGNRDFLIGKRFIKAIGGILLQDPTMASIYGENVLLSHGDLLCLKDFRYKVFRKIIRSGWMRQLLLLMPLTWRHVLASKIRACSENARKPSVENRRTFVDIRQLMVENFMRHYSADYFIHGHFHQAGVHHRRLKDRMVVQMVLGNWQANRGSYLIGKSSNEAGPVFSLCEIGDHHEKTKKISEKSPGET